MRLRPVGMCFECGHVGSPFRFRLLALGTCRQPFIAKRRAKLCLWKSVPGCRNGRVLRVLACDPWGEPQWPIAATTEKAVGAGHQWFASWCHLRNEIE